MSPYKTEWNYLFQTKDPGKHVTTIESICSITFQIRTWTRKYCGCCKRKKRLAYYTHTHRQVHIRIHKYHLCSHILHSKNMLKYASSMKVSYWQNGKVRQFFLSHKTVMVLVCFGVFSNHFWMSFAFIPVYIVKLYHQYYCLINWIISVQA